MPRRRHLIALGTAAAVAVPAVALAAPGDNTRISLSDSEAQPAQESSGSMLSADGRYVLFTSKDNLAGTATNNVRQLYVRDRVNQSTRLVSASAAGAPANADVDEDDMNVPYAISGDGRFVTFSTAASNLATDTNTAKTDVFRKDLQTGAVVVASVNDAGAQDPNGVQGNPDISGDGNRIVFVTAGDGPTLFPGDNNNAMDIVVRDIAAGKTFLASQSSAGVLAENFTERPAISADGRKVAFEAAAQTTNLVTGDDNNASDAFVRNLDAGTTTRVSVATDGTTPGQVNFPDVSGDGRFVIFQSSSKYDPVNDTNVVADVYRRDIVAGQTKLVSALDGDDKNQAGDSRLAAISADGQRVAFETTATLTATDTNLSNSDVLIRDVGTRTTRMANTPQTNNSSTGAGISANGAFVAFDYNDAVNTPFIDGDTNGLKDVFAHEFAPSDTTGPSITLTGPPEATGSASVNATGTVSDPSGVVRLTVNGAGVTINGDGAFSAPVAVAPGANTVTVVATDGSGNTTQVSRGVQRAIPTTPGGPTGAKATPRQLTLNVAPRRDIKAPYRFAITGRLLMPKAGGVTLVDGCKGSLSVRVRAGKRTVKTLKPKLKRSKTACSYRTTLSFRKRKTVRNAKQLAIRSSFGGNAKLKSKTSRTLAVSMVKAKRKRS